MNLQNIDWKKMGIIVGFIALVIILGYLLYALFFAPTPLSLPPEEEPTEELGQLPEGREGEQPGLISPDEEGLPIPAPEEIITQIPAEEETVSPVAEGGITQVNDIDYQRTTQVTLSSDGDNLISYQPDLGKFYTIDEQGNKTELTKRTYRNVQNVSFSPQKDKAILEFPDGSNVVYDFKNDKQYPLPKNWTEFKFTKQGNQIAFKDMNNLDDYKYMGIASPDGSSIKYLTTIGYKANQFKVDWSPNGQMVGQFTEPSGPGTSNIYFVGKNNENFPALTVNGYGVETKWAPNDNRLIYSAYNEFSSNKPLLHIVDADAANMGGNHYSLGLNTWPDKCTFHGTSTLYCAVPKNLPEGADLVPAIADDIPDNIYKVDLKTGAKSFIAQPESPHTIGKMEVSANGKNLFFQDKNTQTVHNIKLK